MWYEMGIMAYYDSHQTKRMEDVHGAELATFWRRAAAFSLDIIVMSLLYVAVVGSLEPLLVRMGIMEPSGRIVFSLNHGWYNVAWVVLYFGLFTYFLRGRTPGKWLMGIRVVSLAHERISLWHSVERALGYGASMLEGGFGFFQYFIHPNKRTVHDRIAETIVVREKRDRKGRRKKAKGKSGEAGVQASG
ncbi:MAG: RDD family protein [Acidobacteriota bacterium]|nr:RDD family protein [Acidobacteriota bacterium]